MRRDRDEVRLFKRIVRRFRVTRDHYVVLATESRMRGWLYWWGAFLVFGAMLGASYALDHPKHPRDFGPLLFAFGIGFSIPIVFFLPWNIQIAKDLREGQIIIRHRYYCVPLFRKRWPIATGELVISSVTDVENVDHSSVGTDMLGCMLVPLGVLGSLLSFMQWLSNFKKIERRYYVLAYVADDGEAQLITRLDTRSVGVGVVNAFSEAA